jgi:anti-sigma-K factor RskA
MAEKSIQTTAANAAGRWQAGGFWRATAATGVAVVAVGALGTLAHRGFGRVPFSVPAWPWYTRDPFYVFWDPRWPSRWLVVALAAAAGVVVLLNSGA